MGSYVSGVILFGSDPGFQAVADKIGQTLHAAGAQKAILTRQPIMLGSENACWYAVSGQHGYTVDEQGEIGRITSNLGNGKALWIHYSDSTGRDAFKLFHSGELVEQSENSEPLGSTFRRAFELVGLQAHVADPEDLVDILLLSDLSGEDAWLIRGGKLLAPPESVQPASDQPQRTAWRLDREFKSLRPLRSAFKVLVWLFGSLAIIGILFVLGSYVWEITR